MADMRCNDNHVCFKCMMSYRTPGDCPGCSFKLIDIGSRLRPPPRNKTKEWQKFIEHIKINNLGIFEKMIIEYNIELHLKNGKKETKESNRIDNLRVVLSERDAANRDKTARRKNRRNRQLILAIERLKEVHS